MDWNSDDAQGQLAADGRLAFTSDKSGELEVYVGRLDRAGRINRVSPKGGFDPRWSGDGRELSTRPAEGHDPMDSLRKAMEICTV